MNFFQWKIFEFINKMFTRFINIMNGLQTLRKTYTKMEKVIKILMSLPR